MSDDPSATRAGDDPAYLELKRTVVALTSLLGVMIGAIPGEPGGSSALEESLRGGIEQLDDLGVARATQGIKLALRDLVEMTRLLEDGALSAADAYMMEAAGVTLTQLRADADA